MLCGTRDDRDATGPHSLHELGVGVALRHENSKRLSINPVCQQTLEDSLLPFEQDLKFKVDHRVLVQASFERSTTVVHMCTRHSEQRQAVLGVEIMSIKFVDS